MTKIRKILAIDGGGMRGIIPATILAHIERETGRAIVDMFDLISGTSTGGIIALALVKPDPDQKDEMNAPDEALAIYNEKGEKIFYPPFNKMLRTVRAAIMEAKYSVSPLEQALKDYFGDHLLKEALKPVVIPTYDIETRMPRIFKSRELEDDGLVFMRDVARATSAAPTYFDPFDFRPPHPGMPRGTLVDGGVIANNPTLCAFAEMMKHGRKYIKGYQRNDPMMVVSIGTGNMGKPYSFRDVRNWGQLQWAKNLVVDMFTSGSVDTVHYQMQEIIKGRQQHEYDESGKVYSSYFRFQPKLKRIIEMDDASDDALEMHRQVALDIMRDQKYHMDKLINILKSDVE